MLQWTRRVLAEYWAQGDEEKRVEVDISPLCNREADHAAIPQGQLGFITYVIKPLYSAIATLLPEAGNTYLEETRAFWEKQRDMKAGYEDIFGAPLEDHSWLLKTSARAKSWKTAGKRSTDFGATGQADGLLATPPQNGARRRTIHIEDAAPAVGDGAPRRKGRLSHSVTNPR
jgi:hypothetical protein